MWQKFVRSTPSLYANSLAVMSWREEGAPMVAELIDELREYEVLSFIIFICYIASVATSFMMAPLLEFLLALFLCFAYASKLNEKFKGLYWPLMDFLRCVTAAIIYFAISIAAVSKYNDGASKAAGVFGFVATIAYAIDFYIIFNNLVTFLKQGSSDSPEGRKSEEDDSDSTSN
nr:PREDICTED: CKLF-like MARVEL transmembrane domain-containing protein 3 [Phalacrocorax carbo]